MGKSLFMTGLIVVLLASCAPAATPPVAPNATSAPAKAASPDAGASAAAPSPTPKPAAEKPRYGGVLTLSVQDDLPSMDLHQETTGVVIGAVGPVYSGLMQYDPLQNDKVIADLAEKWTAEGGGAVHTFYLRKDVKWHDGKPVTAEDVRFSLDRIRKPPSGTRSPRSAVLAPVTNVEAVDEATVRVTLEYPVASFLATIAVGWMAVVPKHIVESKGSMKKDAVGTGPFKLKEYSPGAMYVLARNSDYFVPGRPYLDGVKTYVIRDRKMRLAAFRTGQVLITNQGNTGISPSQAEVLRKEMPDKAVVQTAPAFNFASFMMNSRIKPWDDLRARRAANMSIDRAAAVNVLDEGDGDVGGLMPPLGQWAIPREELLKMPGYRPDKAAELAEARKLMAEAGFENGAETSILVRAGAEPENLAVFVQSQLEKIGVKTTLVVKEVASYESDMARRAFATATWPHAVSLDDPDQIFGEHYTASAARNYQGITNPKVEELFALQSRTLDLAERKRLVVEMQRYAMEDNGKLAFYWKRERQGVWLKVRDYKVGFGIHNNNKRQDIWLAE